MRFSFGAILPPSNALIVCSAVKVGRTDQTIDEVYDNLVQAVEAAAKFIEKKGEHVQSMHIKTTNSVALPIFVALPTAASK